MEPLPVRSEPQPQEYEEPSFAEEAECCLLTLRESLIAMGHAKTGALIRIIDRALARRE